MLIIILILLVIPLFIGLIIYNSLIAKKNQVANVFGTLDALLKKRYDLIPNLVAAVKGYAEHEKGVLTEITELRSRAVSGQAKGDEAAAQDNKMTQLLGKIMITVENYPDLKANENFLKLQGSLNEIEEQISAGRRAYNAAVTEFNNAVEMFPTSIVASLFGHKQKRLFEINQTERENPNIKNVMKG